MELEDRLAPTLAERSSGDATTGPLDMSTTADGSLLAIIFRDRSIQVYSGRTLEPQGLPFPNGLGRFFIPYVTISLSPNSQSLAASGDDPTADRSLGGQVGQRLFSRRKPVGAGPAPRGDRRLTQWRLPSD